jgi:transcriptional regulator with XRE-family HTH domain
MNHQAKSTENKPDEATLGGRLREVRLRSGLSLRAVARQLSVSPSFVSQLENDRSRPSVATLYSLAQLFNVSMDELFDPTVEEPGRSSESPKTTAASPGKPSPPKRENTSSHVERRLTPAKLKGVVSRSEFASPGAAWDSQPTQRRLSITKPGHRSRLVMDSGVVWEQLTASISQGLAFLEIEYPPESSSTNSDRMLRHTGYECGYLLEGELEITAGFETVTMHAGDALGFDSSIPHLFRNRGTVPARGIWCVFDQHP